MADLTEGAERNRLSALKVLVGMLGQVGILVVGFFLWRDGIPDSAFLVTGAIIACGVLVTVLGVREPAPAIWAPERAPAGGAAPDAASPCGTGGSSTGGPSTSSWSSSPTGPGSTPCMPLVSIYLRDILGASVGEAQLLPSLLLLSTTVMALPDRLAGDALRQAPRPGRGVHRDGPGGPRRAVHHHQGAGGVVFLLAGTGNAATMVLTLPILAELVPRRHIGLANGIQAAAGSVAAPLASLAAGRPGGDLRPAGHLRPDGLHGRSSPWPSCPWCAGPAPAPDFAPAPALSPQSA